MAKINAVIWAVEELPELNLPENVNLISMPSPYEAAAEMLASNAPILIIDLNLLENKHAGLIELASSTGIDILGIGRIPENVDTDILSGTRLVSPARLPETISSILTSRPEQPQPDKKPTKKKTATKTVVKKRTKKKKTAPGKIILPGEKIDNKNEGR